MSSGPGLRQQPVQSRQEAVAVPDGVEPRRDARELDAHHRRRFESQEIAGPCVRRFNPAVVAHEDDAVGRGLEDLRLAASLALRRRVQLGVLFSQARLTFHRPLKLTRRGLERLRLAAEIADELTGETNRPRHPATAFVRGARDQRDVQAAAVDDEDLRDLRAKRQPPAVDQDDVRDDGDVPDRREVGKGQSAAERRHRLVGDPEHRQEEEPAALAAGGVGDERKHPHVARQHERAEIEVPPQIDEEQVQGVPGRRAVERQDERQLRPCGPRRLAEDQAVVQQHAERQQGKARNAQAWNDGRIEVHEPFVLPPLGRLDIELEVPGLRIGRRSRRRRPPRESRLHIVELGECSRYGPGPLGSRPF